eukprot:7462878-Ditylum_brightwellii.AAC.1
MPTATTTTTTNLKYYCKMCGPNRIHNTKDCFELKQRAKHAKADTNSGRADKVTYKDLNAFVDAKVTATLNTAKKNWKKEKKVTINAFDNFRSLKVDDSSNEESDHEVNALTNASDDDSNSGASRVDSNKSGSNSE